MPLGLFPAAVYEARTTLLPPCGGLLIFTDGLTDSISGQNPEDRLREALAPNSPQNMALVKSLIRLWIDHSRDLFLKHQIDHHFYRRIRPRYLCAQTKPVAEFP